MDGKRKVGYIYLPSFYTNGDEHGNYMPGCSNDLAKELIKTKREGIEVLILDIRGNGGGAMVEALMKKVVLNICLVLFVATANVKAQAPGEAVEYMNQMGNSFTELKDETWKYLKAVTRGQGARRVEKKRQQLIQEVRAKKNEVSKMTGFYSDNSLKNAVLSKRHTCWMQ
ncbi:S41 family peptidase [Xanthomarina sp.]|uniref:S41 family peptidase n=1 Tax=Xanthomarina sp. TaxID=1931211 RepID=UPI002CCE8595|nr:S41 family peptidase [Xanthomarina sp.]HLV39610.1 S41 family peptidase [Xanthomarina sp.]